MRKLLLLVCTIVCSSTLNGMDPTSLCELRRTGQELSYQALPKELKQEIITTAFADALATSNTVDEVISKFKNISVLHGTSHNNSDLIDLLAKQLPDKLDQAANEVKHLQGTTLKHFTTLMDVLTKKFPDWPREWIANKFKTRIAGRYNTLASTFVKKIGSEENSETALKHAFNFLNDDVDPNYSWNGPDFKSSDRWIIRTLPDLAYNKIFATPSTYGNIYNYNNIHEDMLPILTLLLNRGTKPTCDLMEHARWVAKQYPTDFNSALLTLLEQANAQYY
jgi:hypothetical protein